MLYFDCFSGASGDMILGAMIDLGLPMDALKGALGSLAIEFADVTSERVLRAGVSATKFRLAEKAPAAESSSHKHYHLKHIVAAIRRSALSSEGQDRAVHLFERLAGAEAAIHNTPIERVHLHEVGALDSIIDIVGAVYGFEWFGIDDVMASPLNVGGGTVNCAHGVFPVPAPATARLLEGVPVYSDGQSELVTPTGALLVTHYAKQFGPMPLMRIEHIAYGAGDRDPKDRPNVLRLLRGAREAAALTAEALRSNPSREEAERGAGAPASDRAGVWGGAPREKEEAERGAGAPASDRAGVWGGAPREKIVKLESEIDDMNPQLFGPLMDALHAAGALDVFYTPVQMKKGRPGTLVTIIAPPDRRAALTAILFRDSTTIGVRYQEMSRTILDRTVESVETPYGTVRFKIARRDGEELNAAPEFDDCARLAAERGVSIKTVQAAAIKARLDRHAG